MLMYRLAALVGLLFVGFVSIGVAGPITGGFAKQEKIGTGSDAWKTTQRFRGGERAAVLVANKSEAAARFHIAVYDAKGNLVVEDKNQESSKEDLVSVFWYPPRDAEYRVEIKNLDGRTNACFVTFK